MPIYKNCEKCNKKFAFYPFDIKERKFCSQKCYWISKKGTVGYWLGKKRDSMSNENNPKWKGDKVGYSPLHQWVARKFGYPNKCEKCNFKNPSHYKIHWANKSGKYLRDRNDWIRLCVPCHRLYDGWTKNV